MVLHYTQKKKKKNQLILSLQTSKLYQGLVYIRCTCIKIGKCTVMHLFVRSRYRICFFLWIFKLILELFGQCGMFCLHFIYEHVSSIFRPILNRDLVYISAHFIHTTHLFFSPIYRRVVYSAHYINVLSIFGSFYTGVSSRYFGSFHANAPPIFWSIIQTPRLYFDPFHTNAPSIFRPIIQTSRLSFGPL